MDDVKTSSAVPGDRTPDTPRDPMVVIDGVNKHFGDLHVLRDINLTVGKGEVVVVLGPSGSGKSTLCRAINRLETIESGTISIDGKALPEEGKPLAQLRADVGMVFQSFNLFAHKTIRDNVTLGPIKVRKKSKSEADQQATQLLERVGVEAQADKYPAQLSGGQQQRVAIARSLAMGPKVMLFDEPTSALDPEAEHAIFGRFAEAAARVSADTGGVTVIVSHRMSTARLADRIAVLDAGRLVEHGTHEELMARNGRYSELFELQASRYR